jgi:L-asparagine transporter-like permease
MSQKIPIKKFSFRIILFSAIIAGLTVLFQWLFPQYASPALPFIVLFFFIITLLTMFIVLREDKGREAKKFVSSYMLSRVIKLLSCLVFLLVYILVKKDDAIRFAIAFLAIYFLYSIFEVFLLKKENQEISEKNHEA